MSAYNVTKYHSDGRIDLFKSTDEALRVLKYIAGSRDHYALERAGILGAVANTLLECRAELLRGARLEEAKGGKPGSKKLRKAAA